MRNYFPLISMLKALHKECLFKAFYDFTLHVYRIAVPPSVTWNNIVPLLTRGK